MINELKDALRSNDFDAKDKKEISKEIRRLRRQVGFPMPREIVECILSYMLLPREKYVARRQVKDEKRFLRSCYFATKEDIKQRFVDDFAENIPPQYHYPSPWSFPIILGGVNTGCSTIQYSNHYQVRAYVKKVKDTRRYDLFRVLPDNIVVRERCSYDASVSPEDAGYTPQFYLLGWYEDAGSIKRRR